ncbi:hypothetical protein Tcan_03895 [Toxocara canis]|uniref:Uncharacterized protein n=1 Tax=Toxocara canis TaxID=6265 RepID=A0A0B2UUU6_TOXCA|nr:hypothetical protein Tcan_03895 [Toxocara canis]
MPTAHARKTNGGAKSEETVDVKLTQKTTTEIETNTKETQMTINTAITQNTTQRAGETTTNPAETDEKEKNAV